MDPLLALIPNLPDDLSTLGDDELRSLIADLEGVATRLTDRDAETVGDATLADVLAAATEAITRLETAKGELTNRDAAEAEAQAQLEELRARIGTEEEPSEEEPEAGTEPEPADEPAEEPAAETPDEPTDEPAEEPAAAEELEPVAAAAVSQRRAALPRPAGRARTETRTPGEPIMAPVTASILAEGTGLAIGERITDKSQVLDAFRRKREAMGNRPQGDEKVPILRLRTEYPEDRQLSSGMSAQQIWDRVERVAGPEAVTAAGICAPVTPYYDLQAVSVADRPVRGALATFNADRGGISFAPPPKLTAVTTAAGRITDAQAVAGGSPAVKGCQVIACPTFQQVNVASIYRCIKSDNLNARIYPERLDQFQTLVAAAWAALAETALLDGIAAASTAVTAGQAAGAISDLVKHVIVAAAAQRNRHRMRPDQPLRCLMPAWTLDLLDADLARSQFDRFRLRTEIETMLRGDGVNISWYQDSATGAGQLFGAQGAGALLDFPAFVEWYLFPEGSFLFLDSGELDLGLVRDSTLNSTNEFTMFYESWENIAFVGVESLRVRSTLCDTGQTGNTVAIACAS